jgi:hypothetical protein
MTVDPAGDLYVASSDQVDIYAPGSKTPERVITTDTERVSALGLDTAGNLYVASLPTSSTCGEVAVFAPGTTEPGYVIPASGNACVWDDFVAAPSGEMYALTRDGSGIASIAAYAYGQTSPKLVISNGLKSPTAMVFDNGGNLYVSDYGANAILVYPPGGTTVLREITQGISMPGSIAISSATHS